MIDWRERARAGFDVDGPLVRPVKKPKPDALLTEGAHQKNDDQKEIELAEAILAVLLEAASVDAQSITEERDEWQRHACKIHDAKWDALISANEVAKSQLAQLEADARWRHDWHERLGRGTSTEGQFYESVEARLAQITQE